MTLTLDEDKPYTQVGGREPLVYLQAGAGFDRFKAYIGRFTPSGEPLGRSKELYAAMAVAVKPEPPRKPRKLLAPRKKRVLP